MKFRELLQIVGAEPVFDTGLLLVDGNPTYIRRQLCEWVNKGYLIQLRRGVYALASPYRKVWPHPFLVANRLVRGSYVSLQSALSHHGVIPEFGLTTVTSVTPGPPMRLETHLGTHVYRHVQPRLMHGYQRVKLEAGQEACIATPAKALVDLLYLTSGSDDSAYLRELRLNFDLIHLGEVVRAWGKRESPKLKRILKELRVLKQTEDDYEPVGTLHSGALGPR